MFSPSDAIAELVEAIEADDEESQKRVVVEIGTYVLETIHDIGSALSRIAEALENR